MNARELVACAEAAMMTAKAQGKDRVVDLPGDGRGRARRTRTPVVICARSPI